MHLVLCISVGGDQMENNTKTLLISQMKRAIELLEDDSINEFNSKELAELRNKLHEIRRDSIRFMKEHKSYW